MARVPVNPGTVDWSGENPCILLKRDHDGPFTTLVSYFRVVASPHGPGHAAILLWDGQAEHPHNGIYTDNPTLAAWLRDEFAAHFGFFKDNPLLAGLPIREATTFQRSGDSRTSYSEFVAGPGLDLRLTWSDLRTPVMVELPTDKSATGLHEMFSVFVPAGHGEVVFNGERIEGVAAPRDFHGFLSSYVFLAFAETWVRC